MAKLEFQTNMDITACFDPKGEKLDFPYEKVNHKKINPNDSGGNVERWLIEVEAIMKKSLAYAIDFSMKDAGEYTCVCVCVCVSGGLRYAWTLNA